MRGTARGGRRRHWPAWPSRSLSLAAWRSTPGPRQYAARPTSAPRYPARSQHNPGRPSRNSRRPTGHRRRHDRPGGSSGPDDSGFPVGRVRLGSHHRHQGHHRHRGHHRLPGHQRRPVPSSWRWPGISTMSASPATAIRRRAISTAPDRLSPRRLSPLTAPAPEERSPITACRSAGRTPPPVRLTT
jgi:hypothetical protein